MSRALEVDEILKTIQPSKYFSFSLSSNGEWLAFTVDGLKPDYPSIGISVDVEGSSQWVCHLESGRSFPIMSDASSSWGGVWSPDGRQLAFLSDRGGAACLWLWEPQNNTVKKASDIVVRPFFGFESPIWTLDGKSIVFKAMPSENVNDAGFRMETFINQDVWKGNEIQVFSTAESANDEQTKNWVERYRADIVRLDIETGSTFIIAEGLYPVGMRLSCDGQKLAFTSGLGQEAYNTPQVVYDLWMSSIYSGQREGPKCLAKRVRMEYGLSFSWARDDRSILFTTAGPMSDGSLWAVNTCDDLAPHPLIQENEVHLGHEYDAPLPLANGDVLMVADGFLWRYKRQDKQCVKVAPTWLRRVRSVFPFQFDAEHVIVQTIDVDKTMCGFWKVNVLSGEVDRIAEDSRGHSLSNEGGATISKKNNQPIIVYISQSATEPPSPWLVNVGDKEIRRISELTSFPKESIGTAQVLKWTLQGQEMRGALLLPPDRSGSVPVIIRVYHGKQSEKFHTFGLWNSAVDNHHLFSSRGYAVFLPDLIVNGPEPADEIALGLEAAVNTLKQIPEIDSDRMAIIGHSYGGYAALVSIARLPHFRAAVVSAGLANLISISTMFDPSAQDSFFGMIEGGAGLMLGNHLWEDREQYIRNSPLFEFDRINTPVLLIQGTKDHICFIESGAIYSSLRRLGKNAKLVYYKDEHHWQGAWKLENIQNYYDHVFEWFEEHL